VLKYVNESVDAIRMILYTCLNRQESPEAARRTWPNCLQEWQLFVRVRETQ